MDETHCFRSLPIWRPAVLVVLNAATNILRAGLAPRPEQREVHDEVE